MNDYENKLFDMRDIPAELRQYFEEVETQCLAPYTRVVEREPMQIRNGPKAGGYGSRTTDALSGTMIAPAESRTVGWRASCTCGASIVPCTILDPFAGAGTTIMESLRHGRDAIGVELNPQYAQMARDRIVNDAPMFNAM
jgi:hypothetical protein